MPRVFAALIAGLLFGLGLTISGMINPAKVLGFLDLAGHWDPSLGFLDLAGHWDPSLAFVMGAAIPGAAAGFALARRRGTPLWAPAFAGPTKTRVDAQLVGGAVLFGIGWGLVGYCPGPALASLGFGNWRTLLFTAAMLVGMGGFQVLHRASIVRPRSA